MCNYLVGHPLEIVSLGGVGPSILDFEVTAFDFNNGFLVPPPGRLGNTTRGLEVVNVDIEVESTNPGGRSPFGIWAGGILRVLLIPEGNNGTSFEIVDSLNPLGRSEFGTFELFIRDNISSIDGWSACRFSVLSNLKPGGNKDEGNWVILRELFTTLNPGGICEDGTGIDSTFEWFDGTKSGISFILIFEESNVSDFKELDLLYPGGKREERISVGWLFAKDLLALKPGGKREEGISAGLIFNDAFRNLISMGSELVVVVEGFDALVLWENVRFGNKLGRWIFEVVRMLVVAFFDELSVL